MFTNKELLKATNNPLYKENTSNQINNQPQNANLDSPTNNQTNKVPKTNNQPLTLKTLENSASYYKQLKQIDNKTFSKTKNSVFNSTTRSALNKSVERKPPHSHIAGLPNYCDGDENKQRKKQSSSKVKIKTKKKEKSKSKEKIKENNSNNPNPEEEIAKQKNLLMNLELINKQIFESQDVLREQNKFLSKFNNIKQYINSFDYNLDKMIVNIENDNFSSQAFSLCKNNLDVLNNMGRFNQDIKNIQCIIIVVLIVLIDLIVLIVLNQCNFRYKGRE